MLLLLVQCTSFFGWGMSQAVCGSGLPWSLEGLREGGGDSVKAGRVCRLVIPGVCMCSPLEEQEGGGLVGVPV